MCLFCSLCNRTAALFGLGVALVAAACVSTPRRPARAWERPLLSIRFDSLRDLPVVSNLLILDTTSSVVEDVVELGGRVAAFRDDTLFIEPYYISMYDASRDDRRRTFYRGGPYRLPDLAIVETGAGVVAADYSTPVSRESRVANNAIKFSLTILPFLFIVSFFHHHW